VTTSADIVAAARVWLRDFPRFFSDTVDGNGVTYAYHLSSPLVKNDSSFQAITRVGTNAPVTLVNGTDYTVDARNGYILLTAPLASGTTLYVNFYAYEWFLDDDLLSFTNFMLAEHGQDLVNFSLGTVSAAEAEVIRLGVTVMALWALANELSRDIDVTTFVDGTAVPASQRFRQVMDMISRFENLYDSKAAMLNVGLNRIEAFTLRRVSLTTNRLVPVYIPREIDDLATPQRVYPPRDPLGNAAAATPSYPQAPGGVDPFLWG
jgi:hypothetical protein